jgi:HD-GYP domain-containing protein (c-di-GMP phosphodiesterase class II)/CHASE2 domain-containing sensor protein
VNKLRYLILLIIACLSLVIFYLPLPFLSKLSFCAEDFSSQIFYILNKHKSYAKDIVVVAIDDNSFRKIGQSWPLRRSLYAKALDILNQEQPKAVAFDIIFEGNAALAEDDQEFITALKNFKSKVILGYFLDEDETLRLPKKEFHDLAFSGFINAYTDNDSVVRRLLAYIKINNFQDFSFFLKTVSAFYENKDLLTERKIILHSVRGIKSKNIKEEELFDINYLAKPADIKTVSFFDLINRRFPQGLFRDKIVLVGATLAIAHDLHNTPLGVMPGVYIHANATTDIRENKAVNTVAFPLSFSFALLAIIGAAWILKYFSFLRGLLLYAGIILLLFWFNIYLRFFNLKLDFGNIFTSSVSFVILGNLFNYGIFVAFFLKLKNKMITDPLTGLYNLRYFSEKIKLDSKNIFSHKKYLAILVLDGFSKYSKGMEFFQVKKHWEEIKQNVFLFSRHWARLNEDIVIGVVTQKDDAAGALSKIKQLFHSKGITLNIKAGVLVIKHTTLSFEIINFLSEKIKSGNQEIIYFDKRSIPQLPHLSVCKDSEVSSLCLDAEEKNMQLLKVIEQLTIEERKTKEAYFEMVSSLVSALESKDAYTKGHSQRVCDYAVMLSQELGLTQEEKEKIRKAALLHDLGKIGIPDNILHKKGSFTPEEFSLVKEHEILSIKILEPIKEFRDIAPYILHHHENFDGSGYPHGLAREFIPLGARIISVSDIFDALTTGRDYKNALTINEAVIELQKEKSTKLDPVLVDKFIKVLKEHNLLT